MQELLFLPEGKSLCLAHCCWIEDLFVEGGFKSLEYFKPSYCPCFLQYVAEKSSQDEFQYCDQSSSRWFASTHIHISHQIALYSYWERCRWWLNNLTGSTYPVFLIMKFITGLMRRWIRHFYMGFYWLWACDWPKIHIAMEKYIDFCCIYCLELTPNWLSDQSSSDLPLLCCHFPLIK